MLQCIVFVVVFTMSSRLKRLLLVDLPEIKDEKGCYTFLKQALPDCVIDYKDVSS